MTNPKIIDTELLEADLHEVFTMAGVEFFPYRKSGWLDKYIMSECEDCQDIIAWKDRSPVPHLCKIHFEQRMECKCPCGSGKRFGDCHIPEEYKKL